VYPLVNVTKNYYRLQKFIFNAGVNGFVNFGQRPWWCRGHFFKKAAKIWKRKLFLKEIIKKKEITWGWVKNTK